MMHDTVRAVSWIDHQLRLLDQRWLPQRMVYLDCDRVDAVTQAIRQMVVRGAPAIGIAAAYGVVLAARQRYQQDNTHWKTLLQKDLELLAQARPTAVNLKWALEQMQYRITPLPPHHDPEPVLLAEAQRIHQTDIAHNQAMGQWGAQLLQPGQSVLTHCNAGALATGGYGTALGVIRSAFQAGKLTQVYADETRPWLQGTRLTAWELQQDGIPVSILADGAAAYLMQQGKVQWVIVGADRIAANGDVANKIGTYATAVAARYHGVKFMVVAPTSTIDLATPTGAEIPVEMRDTKELLEWAGQPLAPAGIPAWNPVFDITPAELIDALVTERGILLQPQLRQLTQFLTD